MIEAHSFHDILYRQVAFLLIRKIVARVCFWLRPLYAPKLGTLATKIRDSRSLPVISLSEAVTGGYMIYNPPQTLRLSYTVCEKS